MPAVLGFQLIRFEVIGELKVTRSDQVLLIVCFQLIRFEVIGELQKKTSVKQKFLKFPTNPI